MKRIKIIFYNFIKSKIRSIISLTLNKSWRPVTLTSIIGTFLHFSKNNLWEAPLSMFNPHFVTISSIEIKFIQFFKF